MWESVWSHCAAVDRDVFEPLDVRLRVAEHAAHKRHIAANDCGLVGGETKLQERPVRRALWKTKKKHLRSTSAWKPCLLLLMRTFSYRLRPARRCAAVSRTHSPPRRCSSLYQKESLTPLLESKFGLWPERHKIKLKHLVWWGGSHGLDKIAPWNLQFSGPSWTLFHSCTSAERGRGFRWPGILILRSYRQERRGVAFPSFPASPTAALELVNEAKIRVSVCSSCRAFNQGSSKRNKHAEKATEAYSWAFHCWSTARWIIYFPPRMTHRRLHLPRI